MLEATSSIDAHSSGEAARRIVILVTSMFPGCREADLIGADASSYHFAYHAFLPLLREIGEVIEVDAPESRLDWAAEQARRRGLEPIHLSFRPLQHVYLSSLLPNVAFPLWEFPRIPDEDFADNPRNNWARIAGRLSLVLCASEFTHDAFRRAGVRAPVATVPVPIRDEYFAVDAWSAESGGSLRCETFWLRADTMPPSADEGSPSLRARARSVHENVLRPLFPVWASRRVDAAVRRVKERFAVGEEGEGRWPSSPRLELSGVVYTSFLNPFDQEKNWQDLMSAFVLALADEENATLVIKLVVPPEETAKASALLARHFASLGIPHRCKVALAAGYLSNAELLELTRLSTYYVSATRAEASCLPARDFLAAGRPLIAPVHSALAEYLSFDVGFPVESHPEPTSWPHDPSQSIRTTRHRVVWQSLQEQIWASYVAAHDSQWYAAMAERGTARMKDLAAADRVRPRLQQALEPLFVNAPLYVEVAPLLFARLTGISRFTARLVEALAAEAPLRLISSVERTEARRPHQSTALVWGEEIAIEPGSLPAADGNVVAWTRRLLRRPQRRLDRAALESPCLYSFERPAARRFAREVGVIYDFTPVLLPEAHQTWVRELFGHGYARALAANDAALAISEATKFDAGWLSSLPNELVTVCHPGPSLCVHGHASPRPVERAADLLLVVATREPRKNAGRVLDWFLHVNTLPPGTNLLWVGPKAWEWSLRSTLRYRSASGGNFRFAGEVSDGELCDLYRRATLTIHPSLYEGFGFPVLDSLLHGAPVACSFNSSLKEFAGPGVAYFDPYDSASLDAAVHATLAASRDFDRADLRERCSWEKAAQTALDLARH